MSCRRKADIIPTRTTIAVPINQLLIDCDEKNEAVKTMMTKTIRRDINPVSGLSLKMR
jgi:hypothetical protein